MVYTLVKGDDKSTTLICIESSKQGYSIRYCDGEIVATRTHSNGEVTKSMTEVPTNIDSRRVVALLEEMHHLGRNNVLGEYPKPMKFLHDSLSFLESLKEAEDSVL